MIHLQLCMLCIIHLTLTQSLHSCPLFLSFSGGFIILPALQESSWVCSPLCLLSVRLRIRNAVLHLSGFQLNHRKTEQSYHHHMMTHTRLEDNKMFLWKDSTGSVGFCVIWEKSNECDFLIRPMCAMYFQPELQQVCNKSCQIRLRLQFSETSNLFYITMSLRVTKRGFFFYWLCRFISHEKQWVMTAVQLYH